MFRRSFRDRTSALWEAAPELSLILLESIPSGETNIVSIRYRIQDLSFGPGHLSEFMAGSTFVTPAVLHPGTDYVPDSTTVCVGWGTCAANLSPWSRPFLQDADSAGEARQVFDLRADVV